MKNKIDFELTYLRHRYLKRKDRVNVSEQDFKRLLDIHRITLTKYPKEFYLKNQNFLSIVGMDLEDIKSFSQIQLYSFAGLYSLYLPTIGREAYLKKSNVTIDINSETQDSLINKERSVFISFLKQRLSDLIKMCNLPKRGMGGTITFGALYRMSPDSKPLSDSDIQLMSKEALEERGYEKLFKKDAAIILNHHPMLRFASGEFEHNGVRYRNVFMKTQVTHSDLNIDVFLSGTGEDGRFTFEPYIGSYEDIFDSHKEEVKHSKRASKFKEMDVKQKKLLLARFVANNKDNKDYRKEIATARKLLKSLKE
jgi:hypothetical protein